MKLRIHHNSIRLRLSPADVSQLQRNRSIDEVIRFGPNAEFSYWIKLSPRLSVMQATLTSNQLCVEIPAALAEKWADDDTFGLHHAQEVGCDEPLDILVEKDFECLDSEGQDSDEMLYPNPGKVCQ